jgi:predicted nucleic acid-binding protein
MIVCLDANCVIYLIEANPYWCPMITTRIADLRVAGHEIAVSDLSRTECLAAPFAAGDATILADYQAFFASPTIHILPLTASVCERAARIRAASRFRLKTPDCLHLASAIEHGCGSFLTNDRQLTLCTDILVEILS